MNRQRRCKEFVTVQVRRQFHQRTKKASCVSPKIIPGVLGAGRGALSSRPALQSSLLHRPLRPDSSQPLQQELGVQHLLILLPGPATRSICPVLWDNSREADWTGPCSQAAGRRRASVPAVCADHLVGIHSVTTSSSGWGCHIRCGFYRFPRGSQ